MKRCVLETDHDVEVRFDASEVTILCDVLAFCTTGATLSAR